MTMIVCTNCNKTVEVEETENPITCECGTVIDTGELGLATKACPSCQSEVAIANIICTGCGYNFQTGALMDTPATIDEDGETDADMPDEEVEDDPGFFYRYKPLIKLGVVVGVLGLAALIYVIESMPHFGISSRNPIGTKQEIEEYLLKIGMAKEVDTFNVLNLTGKEGTCITYKDRILFQESKNTFNEFVHVILDKDDKLVAICGKFHSDDMGPKGGRTHGFLRTLWIDLGGDPKAMTMAEHPKVHAKWNKTTQLLGVLELNTETVGVALKGSSYQDIVDAFCNSAESPSLPGQGL